MTALYVASNSQALGSQIQLQRNVSNLGDVLTRLSTGLRINSGKDDPAGLIASELLKSDIVATKQAIQNTQRANSVIAVADSALGQVSSLLNDVRQLVNASANEISMTADQLTANQLQVDASIESIDRIAKTTNFQGQKLLDGSMGFQTSGVGNSNVSNVQVTAANFGSATGVNVEVDLLEAAKKATLIYNGSKVDETTVLNIRGSEGSQTVSLGAGSSVQTMAAAINQYSDSTGVEAFVEGEASRGTITLSSVGANNDVVITAKETGYDAGNYTFRIVEGERNDAYIVSDPTANKSGVIEISLERAYTKTYGGFVDAFDITFAVDGAGAETSVSITRGTKNEAYLATEDQVAAGRTIGSSSVEVTVQNAGVDGHMSNLNGWTFEMVDSGYEFANKLDMDSKTAYFTDDSNLTHLVGQITGATNAHTGTGVVGENDDTDVTVTKTGSLVVGDKFTLANGAAAGELVITYKEGATNQDVVNMINKNSGVTATLKTGVSGDALMKDVPGAPSRASSEQAVTSTLVSSATANDVIRLINTKLGDMFEATTLTGQTGSGYVTYQDASAIYGSVESDNAIRFTGRDDGPVVRLTAGEANQKLGVTLRNPTAEDIKMGITQQVLEVQLATDSAGKSITTAADIVALFDSLSVEHSGGVSASLVLPAGSDINGRTWTTDVCGDESVTTDCNVNYGAGIVGPTGTADECGIVESDIILLGANETIVTTNAVGYVANSAPSTLVAAEEDLGSLSNETIAVDDGGGNITTFYLGEVTGNEGTMPGGLTVTFGSNAAAGASYNTDTKTLTINLTAANYAANGTTVATAIGTALGNVTSGDADFTSDFGLAIGDLAGSLSLVQANGTLLATAQAPTGSVAGLDGMTFTTGSFRTGVAQGDILNGGTAAGYGKGYTTVGDSVKIDTVEDTSILNGVTIKFVEDANAGAIDVIFDSKTGILTITAEGTETAADIETAIGTFLDNGANAAVLAAYNGSAQGGVGAYADGVTLTIAGEDTATTSATMAELGGTSVKINGGAQVGDVVDSVASTGQVGIPGTAGGVADPLTTYATVRTDKATSALNGVSFNFTSDASKAGFNSENGALTVYLNTATQGIAPNSVDQLTREVEQAINGAINDQWEQIRKYTGSTEGPATVTFDLTVLAADATDFSANNLINGFGIGSTTLGFAGADSTNAHEGALRGVSVNDTAMTITSKTSGTDMAGTTIQFVQKDDMKASTGSEAFVEVDYDEKNNVLTIYANASALQTGTDGGINAAVLIAALNNDSTFTKNFIADAPIVNNNAAAAKTTATVAFTSNALAAANKTTMVGGWEIETGTNDGVSKTGVSSSSGISMLNNSDSNERLVLRATEAGKDNYVSIDVIQGSFKTVCPLGYEMSYLAGTDAVVNVNGQRANANGNDIQVSSSNLQATFSIDENMAEGTKTSFNIDGGGTVVQLGPDVVSAQQIRIGIPDVSSATLGGASGKLFQLKTGGIADLKTDTKLADKIVQEAIQSVAMTRGRLGTVQKSTLEPNQAVLEDTMEQLSSAEAIISNADFAEESANLTRAQILVQSGQTVLSLANQFPQYAAALIR